MALMCKLYQNNNEKSSAYNKWFARTSMLDTMDLNAMADVIESNCTVKRADILAVLSEMVVTMKQALQDSKRVKLDHFGTFKMSISTIAANSPQEFNLVQNLRTIRVLFQPEVKKNLDGRTRVFTTGTKLELLPESKALRGDKLESASNE